MTPFSKTVLDEYQVRKSRKQKDEFIALMWEKFPKMEIQRGGLGDNRNLIVGDPETADLWLTAHYDTCSRLPFPNLITPTVPFLSILYSLVVAIPMLLFMFIGRGLVGLFTDDFLITYWVSMAFMFGALFFMMCGPANKHNANDNTSGVITLIELYDKLTEEQRKKVCLIFFDNEEMGLLGSAFFRKKYKGIMKDKLLINFDCVSDGDNIMLCVSKAAREKYDYAIKASFCDTDSKKMLITRAEKTYYPSDQKGFPVHIAVSALTKGKLCYYMDKIHTSRDRVFDEENINLLVNGTVELIDDIIE